MCYANVNIINQINSLKDSGNFKEETLISLRIKEFTNAIRIFSGFNLPIDKAPELFNLFDKVKIFGKI